MHPTAPALAPSPLQVIPRWEKLAAEIEADPEAVRVLGWVREMYAFSLACALTRTALDLTVRRVHPNRDGCAAGRARLGWQDAGLGWTYIGGLDCRGYAVLRAAGVLGFACMQLPPQDELRANVRIASRAAGRSWVQFCLPLERV
jgi:hypothetical protein